MIDPLLHGVAMRFTREALDSLALDGTPATCAYCAKPLEESDEIDHPIAVTIHSGSGDRHVRLLRCGACRTSGTAVVSAEVLAAAMSRAPTPASAPLGGAKPMPARRRGPRERIESRARAGAFRTDDGRIVK